jgi:hypothetical protein
LLSVKQGPNDLILAYIAKFERILYEAHGQDWPDVNKISIFRNSLTSILRTRLAQQLNLPRDYVGFIRVVQQLASRASTSAHTSQPHTAGSSSNTSSGLMQIGSISTIDTFESDLLIDSEEEGSLISY